MRPDLASDDTQAFITDPLWRLEAAGIRVGIIGSQLFMCGGGDLTYVWGGSGGSYVAIGSSRRVAVCASSSCEGEGPYLLEPEGLGVLVEDIIANPEASSDVEGPAFDAAALDADGGASPLRVLTAFATTLLEALRYVGDLPPLDEVPLYVQRRDLPPPAAPRAVQCGDKVKQPRDGQGDVYGRVADVVPGDVDHVLVKFTDSSTREVADATRVALADLEFVWTDDRRLLRSLGCRAPESTAV